MDLPPGSCEVRCAGCGETLEVEARLTEFICPDCRTPQALPPELMPPQRRRALPLPVPGGVDPDKVQSKLREYLECSTNSASAVAVAAATLIPLYEPRLPPPVEVEEARVDPPVDSAAKHSKRVTRCPIGPMMDCSNHGLSTRRIKRVARRSAGPMIANTDQQQVSSSGPSQPQNQQVECYNHVYPAHIGPTLPQLRSSLSHQDQVPHPSSNGSCRNNVSAGKDQPTAVQLQPSEQQDGHSNHVLSTRNIKRAARCPMEPMTGNNGQQQIALSCPMCPQNQRFQCYNNLYTAQAESAIAQPSTSLSHQSQVPCATSKESCQLNATEPTISEDQQNSVQLQPSQHQYGSDTASGRKLKKKRGPTLCLKVWSRPEGDLIHVNFNSVGQPVGKEATILSNFLGTIARDGKLAPLTYVDWRALPDENKDIMWQVVQSKFDIDLAHQTWVLKSLGKKWKDWKCDLKRDHYDTHETDEDRLADRDLRVVADQWPILVAFWSSEEGKARSTKNKANRKCLKSTHVAGTKSFARIREEERLKRQNKEEPTRDEVFIMTHTRKDGRPMDDASSDAISRLRQCAGHQSESSQGSTTREDIFSQVMGDDRSGRVRTYGLGPSPSDIWGERRSRHHSLRMAAEVKRLAEKEVSSVKDKMLDMEQKYKQMQEEMASMQTKICDMHRMLHDKQQLTDEVTAPSELLFTGPAVNSVSTPEDSF